MEKQINSISQLPFEIIYNNIEAFLSYDTYRGKRIKLYYLQTNKFKDYLLHETDAFYVIGKTEKEAVMKMYNLLKQKNII